MPVRTVGNLPAEISSFVGRRRSSAEVKRVLSSSRLVTLTGVGGVGKSRLALHVARDVRRAFPDGEWLVELAGLRDPALLVHTVATGMALPAQTSREPLAALLEYVADKRLLIVLDNCEHVLEASARLLNVLLPAAPGVQVLATSREPLRVAGEQVWMVPPLSLPRGDGPAGSRSPADSPGRYEALALFAERAAAVAPGFRVTAENEAAVARLCQRLDGLPLAIELAAVWLRVLPVEELLVRLENRYDLLTTGYRGGLAHHETLQAAVEWSFDLCSPAEKTLWTRLSVFAGGCDLDAVESVCAGDGLDAEQVFTAVAGLVDKSVLVSVPEQHGGPARYSMLATIRQFGRQRLRDGDDHGAEVVLRRRHRDYYLGLAERADRDVLGPRQWDWVMRIRAEQANLWAAFEFCLTQPGEGRAALRMVRALWFPWTVCGVTPSGRHLDRALALDTQPTPERAKALWVGGWLRERQGDPRSATSMLQECAALARRFNDRRTQAYAAQFLARAAINQNDLAGALRLNDQAMAWHRAERGWPLAAMASYPIHSTIHCALGNTSEAIAVAKEGRAICEHHGDQWVLSWILWALGLAQLVEGDVRVATTHMREALRLKGLFADSAGIASCIDTLALAAASSGDAERVARLLGAAEERWKPIGRPLTSMDFLLERRARAQAEARAALGDQAFEAACQHGRHLTADEAVAYALGKIPAPAVAKAVSPLTPREDQVARLVAQGLSNKDIAGTLVISQRTAETHVEHILVKLGFTSRTQVATWLSSSADQ
ncbi:LuxR C-terminal-related transcriptional regulator [Amycolatopsis pigmentata]|uniref:LuxR C-terminal-related transcriptional regulator n=1 Tax=Amycolatopsis pigmentata TaxID=450801 RepID=A0ABW5GAF4_9PSEU